MSLMCVRWRTGRLRRKDRALLLGLVLVLAFGGVYLFFVMGYSTTFTIPFTGTTWVRPPARCPVCSPRTLHGPPSVHRRPRTRPCAPSGLNHEIFTLGKRRSFTARRPRRPPRSSLARRRPFLPRPRRPRTPTSPPGLPPPPPLARPSPSPRLLPRLVPPTLPQASTCESAMPEVLTTTTTSTTPTAAAAMPEALTTAAATPTAASWPAAGSRRATPKVRRPSRSVSWRAPASATSSPCHRTRQRRSCSPSWRPSRAARTAPRWLKSTARTSLSARGVAAWRGRRRQLRELREGPCARVHMTPKVRCGGGPGGDTTDTTAVKRSLRTCRGQQAKVPSDADSEPEESMSKRVSRLTAHARTHPRTNGF